MSSLNFSAQFCIAHDLNLKKIQLGKVRKSSQISLPKIFFDLKFLCMRSGNISVRHCEGGVGS